MQELYDLDKYFFDNRGKLIFAKRIDGTEVRRLTAGNPAEIDVFPRLLCQLAGAVYILQIAVYQDF
jgi:hypothetical protein